MQSLKSTETFEIIDQDVNHENTIIDLKDKFDITSEYIDDQPGNYRETLRVNDDLIRQLNWKPQDRLLDYINSLNL